MQAVAVTVAVLGAGLFPTVLRTMLEVTTGTYTGPYLEDPEEAEIDRHALEKGFGLERARMDRIGEVEPWLSHGWVDEAIAGMSGWVGSLRWENQLAVLSDQQLLQARDETRFVLELFGGFSLVFDELIGRGRVRPLGARRGDQRYGAP